MRRIMIAFITCALLAACGNESAEPSGSEGESGSQAGAQSAAQKAPTLEVASSDFGDMTSDGLRHCRDDTRVCVQRLSREIQA